ncbi:hypothetical protein FE251_12035 [Georgenia wutianyii]|uniref:Uncharacterized protein n=1 Tax=Georgenia wutianyii TaxID=2585135 RepID=A0ABX5VP82_9MICO|nr:hypothetical protein [Georgenia wutianyii]QDB80028.1 hypothetical protein FE251_12035 [Georgenia wutianyii]
MPTFTGRIAGWGTASGTRLVLGAWHDSPLGTFADVMVERPDGERLLLAPSAEVAEFVSATYTFDSTVVTPVSVVVDGRPLAATPTSAGQVWELRAGPLTAHLLVGERPALGRVLRLVPRRLATAPALTRVTDPVARALLRGVRTRGSAGGGRTEHYGAHDLHRLVAAGTRWEGTDLGPLRPLDPPVRFGFGSAPRDPGITDLVTTIRLPH